MSGINLKGIGRNRMADIGGFTLPELLVVSMLLAVISLTAYSGLQLGVQIWKRTEASVKNVDLALALKKFRKDLVAQIRFRPIGFYGTPEEVSFPGLVTMGGEGLTHEEVGRIRYLFNESGDSLCREEQTYVEATRGGSTDCEPVISAVKKISFEYYGSEGLGEPANWQSAWGAESPPLAVRLEITVAGAGGKGENTKQYTTTLPY